MVLEDSVVNRPIKMPPLDSDEVKGKGMSPRLQFPSDTELLLAVQELLSETAKQVDKRSAYFSKVSKNLLEIVKRRLVYGNRFEENERKRLMQLTSSSNTDLLHLRKHLSAMIDEGLESRALQEHLWESAVTQIFVDNPKYSGYTRLNLPSAL